MPSARAADAYLVRLSESADGTQASGTSEGPALSADGRYAAFTSSMPNLVTGDGNGVADVFVRDRQAGTTERISVATGGGEAHGESRTPVISNGGRFVAFVSSATDLVSGDGNGVIDVFVRDRQLGVTTVESQGAAPPQDVGSSQPALNGDGRWLAFRSSAENLVAGDTNLNDDIVVKDIGGNDAIRRVSAGALEQQADSFSGPHLAISDDGLYVGLSNAVNLVRPDSNETFDVFVRYALTPTIDTVSPSTIARGSTTTVAVDGSGFLPTATASASFFTAPGVSVDAVAFVSQAQIQLTISVAPDAATGPRILTVTNPGTGPGPAAGASTLCECLTVS
ncbi:MAG: TolB family protein [Acidimicrobiia bacterium]